MLQQSEKAVLRERLMNVLETYQKVTEIRIPITDELNSVQQVVAGLLTLIDATSHEADYLTCRVLIDDMCNSMTMTLRKFSGGPEFNLS